MAGKITTTQHFLALNTGEVDETLAARQGDSDKLPRAARVLENMHVAKFGEVVRRAGTEFIAQVRPAQVAAFDLAALTLFEDPYADKQFNYDFLTVQIFSP